METADRRSFRSHTRGCIAARCRRRRRLSLPGNPSFRTCRTPGGRPRHRGSCHLSGNPRGLPRTPCAPSPRRLPDPPRPGRRRAPPVCNELGGLWVELGRRPRPTRPRSRVQRPRPYSRQSLRSCRRPRRVGAPSNRRSRRARVARASSSPHGSWWIDPHVRRRDFAQRRVRPRPPRVGPRRHERPAVGREGRVDDRHSVVVAQPTPVPRIGHLEER